MMKKAFFYIFAAVCLAISNPQAAEARACTVAEADKAEYLAGKAGQKIIDQYGGGLDERVDMSSCSFNTYSGEFKVGIEIHWNGAMFRSNYYNVNGYLQMQSDGSQANFSRTYANANVQDLEVVIGVVTVLDNLSEESGSSAITEGSSSSAASAYPIQLENGCSHPVSLLVRYHHPDFGWQVTGWWAFAPGERSFLSDEGERLETDKSTLYYYAETTDGSDLRWTGDYSYYYNDTLYDMSEVVDKEGVTSWKISCSA
ncbi:MAG: hypothetical protein AAFQ14_08715 [Cyanobacteria bacterium J06621_12]